MYREDDIAREIVRVRAERTLESDTVGFLQPGDAVQELEQREGWSRIRFQHRASAQPTEGWLRSRYLEAAPPP